MDVTYLWHSIGICAFGYLIGGIPIGWLLVRWKRYGLDVRQYGSGNIGTSNVYRHAGVDIAVIVGPAQFAQGLIPVVVARLLGFSIDTAVIVALCAVAGNGWPVYLRFNGGRGVAVATGAVAALTTAGLIALLMCYAWGAIRGRIAVGVVMGFCILPLVALFFPGNTVSPAFPGTSVALGSCGMLALILLRRLEGLADDTRTYGHFWRRVYQRLVFDERPGRPLMGPRTDPGGNNAEKSNDYSASL